MSNQNDESCSIVKVKLSKLHFWIRRVFVIILYTKHLAVTKCSPFHFREELKMIKLEWKTFEF